jgi:predicted nucleic acid-binding protein
LERKYGRSPYLETTIFNFPFADDAPQYRADTLRLFEEIKAGKFDPYTSQYVIEELLKTPDKEKRDKMIGFIDDYRVKILERCDNAETLAAVYVAEGIIPEAYETDALHIAAATVNRLDCIISLNFKHIVRARTIETTELVNYRAGYKKIGIYTPAEVIYEDN